MCVDIYIYIFLIFIFEFFIDTHTYSFLIFADYTRSSGEFKNKTNFRLLLGYSAANIRN